MQKSLIVLLLTLLTGADLLAQQTRPVPRLPTGIKAERDIAYVKDGHARQILDIYYPEKADKPLPLVIWIHGGAWQAGSKDGSPAFFLLQQGYAVASINYRLSQHATYPAQIEDCKAAVRFLRANAKQYNINPDRFGVWGGSAGGHLVALLGTSGDVKELEGNLGNNDVSSRVQAVVDFFGPTDFMVIQKQMIPGARFDHDSPNSPESRLIGGPVMENKEKCARANPITFITRDDPPFLIVHGDKDPTVPIGQSELLNEALKKAGVPVTFEIVAGGGHGGAGFSTPERRKLISDFLDKHLK